MNTSIDKSYFFYSIKGQDFLPLHLPARRASRVINYKTYITDYDEMNYNLITGIRDGIRM